MTSEEPQAASDVWSFDRKRQAEQALRGNEAYQRGMAEGMKKFNSSPLDPENNPYTTKENPAEQQNENKNINHLIY